MKMSIVMITAKSTLMGINHVNIMISLRCEVQTTGGKVGPKREWPLTLETMIVGSGKSSPNTRANTCRDRLFHFDARSL